MILFFLTCIRSLPTNEKSELNLMKRENHSVLSYEYITQICAVTQKNLKYTEKIQELRRL